MIERKRANIVLNEAKNAGIPGRYGVPMAIGINEVQDNICRLQPINGILNILLRICGTGAPGGAELTAEGSAGPFIFFEPIPGLVIGLQTALF